MDNDAGPLQDLQRRSMDLFNLVVREEVQTRLNPYLEVPQHLHHLDFN
jgi:hypothetical protein